MSADPKDRSYRALLAAPELRRALFAMLLGRVGETMLPIALVLTALALYDSPPLAGVLTSLTVLPGLIAAPVIGALIDRFGRVRLIRLDYVVGAVLTALLMVLTASRPDPSLLIGITLVLGVTQMFSDAGTRSLFADTVPDHLWERVNAADSVGYQVAWILGPSLAAILFSIGGAPLAFGAMAVALGVATWAVQGIREAARAHPAPASLLGAARSGLAYVWRNRTLRAMAASVSVTNLCFGIITILVPVIIVDELAADESYVGVAFAVGGVVGIVAAVMFGRMNTLGRERILLVLAPLTMALTLALLLPAATAGLAIGLAWILVSMVVFGITNGMWDIGIFTLRQRRTDPHMVGRAFAISMALNQSGYPIGAAIGGWLAAISIDSAVALGAVFGGLGAILALVMLPRDAPVDALARSAARLKPEP